MPPTAGFRAVGHPDKQENIREAEIGTDASQNHRETALDKLNTNTLVFIAE